MLITGASGFAMELLQIVFESGGESIVFYDDLNLEAPDVLFGQYPVLKNKEDAERYFHETDPRFVIGVGGPLQRRSFSDKMSSYGGTLSSAISTHSRIGSFGNDVGLGVCIMQGAVITNNVIVGTGTLVNLNATIGHGCRIGRFCDISPGVNISGNCLIGDFVSLGTNATVLPGITITDNVVIGASALVTRDITEPGIYVGVPARRRDSVE